MIEWRTNRIGSVAFANLPGLRSPRRPLLCRISGKLREDSNLIGLARPSCRLGNFRHEPGCGARGVHDRPTRAVACSGSAVRRCLHKRNAAPVNKSKSQGQFRPVSVATARLTPRSTVLGPATTGAITVFEDCFVVAIKASETLSMSAKVLESRARLMSRWPRGSLQCSAKRRFWRGEAPK
jgi:hypothetical protein